MHKNDTIQLNIHTNQPSTCRIPSCLQATLASSLVNTPTLSQTLPHALFIHTSSLPWLGVLPPIRRSSPSLHDEMLVAISVQVQCIYPSIYPLIHPCMDAWMHIHIHTHEYIYTVYPEILVGIIFRGWRISCHTTNIKSANIAPTT